MSAILSDFITNTFRISSFAVCLLKAIRSCFGFVTLTPSSFSFIACLMSFLITASVGRSFSDVNL